MMTVMLGCGHAANATHNGEPCCAICFGIRDGATTVVDAPDLTGRKAVCSYGDTIKPSSLDLPFFRHQPDKECDSFYCGCWGWN